mgnify:CR=1 FL=1
MPERRLFPASELPPLIERRIGTSRAGHQEAIALFNESSRVLSVWMGVAARNVVFLADGQDRVYRVGDHRMVVLSGVSKLLAQIEIGRAHV